MKDLRLVLFEFGCGWSAMEKCKTAAIQLNHWNKEGKLLSCLNLWVLKHFFCHKWRYLKCLVWNRYTKYLFQHLENIVSTLSCLSVDKKFVALNFKISRNDVWIKSRRRKSQILNSEICLNNTFLQIVVKTQHVSSESSQLAIFPWSILDWGCWKKTLLFAPSYWRNKYILV